MMLLISIVLGVVPLIGIAWTFATGTIATVDGLFMSLILLTISGVFLLNAALEMKARGWLPSGKGASGSSKEPPAAKPG